jgi:hypothetical protein
MPNETTPTGGIVHEIRWSDALPWWILFRAAGCAFTPTVILLAALGVAAVWAGGSVADRLGFALPEVAVPGMGTEGIALADPDGTLVVAADPLLPSRAALPWLHEAVSRLPGPVRSGLQLVATPFRPDASLAVVGAAAARIGWFLLVWAIFGTAICRVVALKLAGEEPPGPLSALGYGSQKWPPAVNSVLFVLVGIAALSIPGALIGLGMRTEWGLAFAGAVWPLVLLGAVVLAILAIGVVAGWPLMVAGVGVERADSFQAISTAFSYLYQRPLHFAFYLLVAAVVAIPSLAAAGLFADATGSLAIWAASFGMGHGRTQAVIAGLSGGGPLADAWGLQALRFWSRGLANLLGSFGMGYFWSIATAAYLVLRQDVDGTMLDEIVLEEPGMRDETPAPEAKPEAAAGN